jgi:hypothetical protein
VAQVVQPAPRALAAGERDRLHRGAAGGAGDRGVRARGPQRRGRHRARGGGHEVALGGREPQVVQPREQRGQVHAGGARRQDDEVGAALRRQQLERRPSLGLAHREAGRQQAGVELLSRPQRGERVGLGQRKAQLGAQAVPAHGGGVGGRRELAGVLVDREPQARGVAGDAPEPGGVVTEARVVQHPQAARLQILERSVHGVQARVEPERHGIHRDVAAAQVLVQRARPHVGQCARALVALGAGADEVQPAAVGERHRRRAEALVDADVGRPRRQAGDGGTEVAGDDEVELARRAPQQRVADRSAHHEDAVLGPVGAERVGAAGQRAKGFERLRRGPHRRIVLITLWPCSRAAVAPGGGGPSCSGACSWLSCSPPV